MTTNIAFIHTLILKVLVLFLLRQNIQFYYFFNDLNKFNSLNPQSIKERKVRVYDNTPELYNEYLEIYFDQYMALLDARKRKLENKYNPINLFLDTYNYNSWFEESHDTNLKKK